MRQNEQQQKGMQIQQLQSMLDQLKIQKEQSWGHAQSPSSNKVQHYFQNSSFLHQQQQLSVFIKDLPIINLKEVRSLNMLLSMLIKQNQLLGHKCQQQVSLLKQSYLKYDKLVKTNKELKLEKEKLQQQKLQIINEASTAKSAMQADYQLKQQAQMRERKHQAEQTKLSVLLKQSIEKANKMTEFVVNLCNEEFKKCSEIIKYNAELFEKQQEIEVFLQKQKKRMKVHNKIRNIISQFCMRLQKIGKVVSPTLLTNELNRESTNMMELIDELMQIKIKKKKGTEQSSVLNSSDFATSSKKNIIFFQQMLQRLTQNSLTTNNTKQNLAKQLEEVKNSLRQSKLYYQNAIKNVKEQFVKKQIQINKTLFFKEQSFKYYQEQNEKLRLMNESWSQQNSQLNSKLSYYKGEVQSKSKNIQGLQQKIKKVNQQLKNEMQKLRRQNDIRIQELSKLADIRVNQREQIINQLNIRRRKEVSAFQEQIEQLKCKIKNLQLQNQKLGDLFQNKNKNNLILQDQHNKINIAYKQKEVLIQKYKQQRTLSQQKILKIEKQIYEYKQVITSIQRQKSLQSSYISELENKIETVNNKIKNLQSKSKNDAVSKKQITSLKNTIIEERQKNQQYENYCNQIKQQNQRLKTIVKDMKKQVEQVYTRLAELKEIQSERQKLMIECQSSERIHEGLIRENQQLKFEMLKLQAENKKITLEHKHFKNIISAIEFSEQN